MPGKISIEKRDQIVAALAEGKKPGAIAGDVGVSRTTVRNIAADLAQNGGLPALKSMQLQTSPAALAYIEGDDEAVKDLLGMMDLKAQAETMRILVQARNVHSASRSCDVAELYEILQYSAHQSKAVLGAVASDEQLREWWTNVDAHIRAHYPKLVDRMSRAGLPL